MSAPEEGRGAAADPVRTIADAVLYEGYILWPYRRSAMKNQQRWTFGGVYPEAHHAGRDDDPSEIQAQVLVEGGDRTTLEVGVRFLHVVSRGVARHTATGLEALDELTIAGQRHLSWEEAVEREVTLPAIALADLREGQTVPISIPAGEETEALGDGEGAIVRRWRGLEGSLEVGAEEFEPGLHRIAVRITNRTPWEGGPRPELMQHTFCSTHAVLRAREGAEFVSLTDPPENRREAAESCRNAGVWPVFVGDLADRSTMLASPIILEDHPQIAPESPGDLFDGGEIDQMLVLNILTLTDAEKAEMRDSDPRTREILERTEALSEDELMRLHGAVREFGMARQR